MNTIDPLTAFLLGGLAASGLCALLYTSFRAGLCSVKARTVRCAWCVP